MEQVTGAYLSFKSFEDVQKNRALAGRCHGGFEGLWFVQIRAIMFIFVRRKSDCFRAFLYNHLIRLIVTMKKVHAPTTTSRSSQDPGKNHTSQKPALKVCHLSDIHLGYRKYQKLAKSGINQRELDVALAFREAIDRVIGLAPQLVLFSGDIFFLTNKEKKMFMISFFLY